LPQPLLAAWRLPVLLFQARLVVVLQAVRQRFPNWTMGLSRKYTARTADRERAGITAIGFGIAIVGPVMMTITRTTAIPRAMVDIHMDMDTPRSSSVLASAITTIGAATTKVIGSRIGRPGMAAQFSKGAILFRLSRFRRLLRL